MRKSLINISVCVWLFAYLFLGCERRPIDFEYNDGLTVQVNIDWSAINPRPEYLKLMFYPEDNDNNSNLFRYINPDGERTKVPYGDYSVLLYNWRTNNESQTVKFTADDIYTNFLAYTDFINLKTFKEKVLLQPDSLYSWSMLDSVVPIYDNDSHLVTINTQPTSLVKSYDFFIPVNGLGFVSGGEAIMSGMARGVYLYNKRVDVKDEHFPDVSKSLNKDIAQTKASNTSYSMVVSVKPTTGGLNCHFSAFGYIEGEKNNFTINLVLVDGSTITHTEDLTSGVHSGKISIRDTIEVPHVKITGGGAFKDPEVAEWEDVRENIPI